MKGNKGTTHDTGLLSGGMEAWKLKSLLLQLLLSIGEKGHIVPNKTDHHIRLQILKRILFHKMKTGETVVPNIRDIKGGNKEHYFFHYKEAIKQLGPDVRLWDTEHSEKLHQPAVKEAHRKSSKRYI